MSIEWVSRCLQFKLKQNNFISYCSQSNWGVSHYCEISSSSAAGGWNLLWYLRNSERPTIFPSGFWSNMHKNIVLKRSDLREAFKNDLQNTYGIFRVSGGIIFHMFSATHQHAFKAILGIFRHFYFFPLCSPPHQTRLEIF